MCDYSLLGLPNRLAIEGEQLVVHRFPTHSVGLAPSADPETPAEEPRERTFLTRLRSTVKSWSSLPNPTCAVCVPPGARLLLRDIPAWMQRECGVDAAEEVSFVQLGASVYTYRDAVRFRNGQELLLQRLEPGQRVDVLSLSPPDAVEEEAEREAGKARLYLRELSGR